MKCNITKQQILSLGFSKSELKESGLNNIRIARKSGIPVDVFRKTKIPENIEVKTY
jgi:ribosomal protein L13E